MGDKNFTFFELHFDGPLRIGPSFGEDPAPETNATDGGETPGEANLDVGDTGATADWVDEDDDLDRGIPVKGAIVGFLLIVALAVAARVLLGGDDEDVPDVEMVDLDDTADDETI
jgi:hypothetical protein